MEQMSDWVVGVLGNDWTSDKWLSERANTSLSGGLMGTVSRCLA